MSSCTFISVAKVYLPLKEQEKHVVKTGLNINVLLKGGCKSLTGFVCIFLNLRLWDSNLVARKYWVPASFGKEFQIKYLIILLGSHLIKSCD